MKKNQTLYIVIALIIFPSCHKANTDFATTDFNTIEQSVITEFTNNVALGTYSNLRSSAD
ncbi:MAG: hypothetical protein C5B59_02010 [Bacteroidetes bacterium]|nr:MAG: hypothetical protein C5B59_02010 [Bacteroidota bacterium]